MKARKKTLTILILGLIALSFTLSYFHRPKPPVQEIVTANQEIPEAFALKPSATSLSHRVSHSFALALVLVKSDFSDKNAHGLEALRVWAQQHFQQDQSFLHPVTLNVPVEVQHSIFDSLLFNLIAGPLYFMQDKVMDFLTWRIDQFHDSRSYESFRNDYYEVFGADSEAAYLLARYQAERAKDSVNVILCAIFWALVSVGGVFAFLFTRHGSRSTRGQKLLAYGWQLTALLYLIIAWTQNQVAVLVAAIICGLVGLYLRRPITVKYDDERGLTFKLVSLSPRVIAVCCWISFSLLAIRLLTWIKTGTILVPDPVSMLASSWSGDFLHDPVHAKRDVSRLVGVAWILFGLWVAQYVSIDRKAYREVEEGLSSLKTDSLDQLASKERDRERVLVR